MTLAVQQILYGPNSANTITALHALSSATTTNQSDGLQRLRPPQPIITAEHGGNLSRHNFDQLIGLMPELTCQAAEKLERSRRLHSSYTCLRAYTILRNPPEALDLPEPQKPCI